MTLNDLTWQLNGGVVLNDDSLDIPFVDIVGVSGFDNAPYRETTREHEGVDGGFLDAQFESGRDIVFDAFVYADVTIIEQYLDLLKSNFAPVSDPIPLVFKAPGVNERVIYVKPRGCRYSWDGEYRTGTVSVQFQMYAEDPRFYDNVLQSTSIGFAGPATTGFAFNFGFNLSFGVTVPASAGSVVNGGNRPTPAIMTIQGPCVNPRIINTTTGESMNFIVTLGASDTLVIDTRLRTVLLNGNNARVTLQAPVWFLFPPGTTNMSFGGQSGTGSVLVIQFRNAWR